MQTRGCSKDSAQIRDGEGGARLIHSSVLTNAEKMIFIMHRFNINISLKLPVPFSFSSATPRTFYVTCVAPVVPLGGADLDLQNQQAAGKERKLR